MPAEGNAGLLVLVGSAALVGLAHTLLVPDHYLPFIVLARSERWSRARAVTITALSGFGRVVAAVILGLIIAGAGGALGNILPESALHGNWSAWALLLFGFGYAVYGIILARHGHGEGDAADGPHNSGGGQGHSHLPPALARALEHESHDCTDHGEAAGRKTASLTPWLFFVVFLLGPCKVLAVGLILPALKYGTGGMLLVAGAFGATTMATMILIVVLGAWGLGLVQLGRLERYSHALAGAVIVLSALVLFLLPHHDHGELDGQDHDHDHVATHAEEQR